jgi:glycolate oxidase iron-sulfur subunit
VHCGFCLPTCPTYELWGEEMDSPRGRIHLVTQLLDGAPLTEATAGHFDKCLGCMACMTACPSGVQYDQIIDAVRPAREYRRS